MFPQDILMTYCSNVTPHMVDLWAICRGENLAAEKNRSMLFLAVCCWQQRSQSVGVLIKANGDLV